MYRKPESAAGRPLRQSLAALLIGLAFSAGASANETVCPNAELLSAKLVTDICWGCLFPIRIAGVPFGGGPPGASNQSVCACNDDLGVPRPGWTSGMWEPARIVELVRFPGCAPALNGARLPLPNRRQLGSGGDGTFDNADKVFYHYHYYAFPLLIMMDLWLDSHCNAGGYSDMDLMYLSELDPTWNHDDLAFFVNPEAAAVANPLAVTACAAEAVTAAAGETIDSLFWCAGSWGHLYPLSGYDANAGMVQNTSKLATRAVAALHRRGMAWQTMGNSALCGGYINPMLPKRQYKWTMFFPLPEANQAHVTGSPATLWGAGRMLPGVGEDAVYILWRWNDCCNLL
jgi:conjugal transfer pilus assembly protein TraU